MSNEIQGSRFARSNIGSLLLTLVGTRESTFETLRFCSTAKPVTEHNGFSDMLQEALSGNDSAFHTDTQMPQKVMLTS